LLIADLRLVGEPLLFDHLVGAGEQ
jgi:hypothetical protein